MSDHTDNISVEKMHSAERKEAERIARSRRGDE